MEDKWKKIKFFGMKPTRSLHRFIERQVEKWIILKHCNSALSTVADYEVKVEREETHPYFHCSIDAVVEGKRWHGPGSGRTLQRALAEALRHMKTITLVVQDPLNRTSIETIDSKQVA